MVDKSLKIEKLLQRKAVTLKLLIFLSNNE